MRPLVAQIRLDALRHNYQYLKSVHGKRLLAVIKADAYGHGAVPCAQALAGMADGFAVACIEEALTLREAGITAPIVLLEGVFENSEYLLIDEHRLWPVIQSPQQLQGFMQHTWRHPVSVWLKLDSGMRRAGFTPQTFQGALASLQGHAGVANLIAMTHLARADEPAHDATARQLAVFDEAVRGHTPEHSIANSAGILAHPHSRRDWGRAGLALYGISPFLQTDVQLRPVMSLSTQVFGVRELAPGESVGYGGIFTASYPMRLGLIACGYADGYPRSIGADSPVWIDGVKSRIVGRISMDMITVELNDPAQGVGSSVELWGEHIPVNQVAQSAGTISYEVLCHLKRARKVYTDAATTIL